MSSSKSNKFADALRKPASKGQALEQDTLPHDRPSRRGAKHVGGYFAPEVSKQLRAIALEEDSSVQQLLGEALNLLFQSRRKPTIAKR